MAFWHVLDISYVRHMRISTRMPMQVSKAAFGIGRIDPCPGRKRISSVVMERLARI